MEDFGDILFYLVVAIIAIAGAIINKKKSKEQAYPIPDHGEEEDDNIDYEPETRERAMRYEMIDEDSLRSDIPEFEDAAIQSSVDEGFKMDAEYEGKYAEPMASDFAWEGQSVTEVAVEQTELGTEGAHSMHEEDSWAAELAEEFDLPKAIVYSEILKRKDFV